MVSTIARLSTLLVAVGILLIGHGLQLTLLPLHALAVGWSSTEIGLTGSLYFLGFVAGCVLLPASVSRVGHIRAFMVMAAVATVALLTAALFVNVWAWLLLRFATGLSFSGLYMIIESWLTDVSPKESRGTVLSVYLAISLLGMAVGQMPLSLVPADDVRLFILAAVLLSIAIVPIGLTSTRSPNPIPAVRVTPRTLMRASRVAVVCAVFAGMVTSVFWALGPVVGGAFGLDPGRVGLMMSLGVLGGAATQYPVGRVSDRLDRRLVIGILAVVGAVLGTLGAVFAAGSTLLLYVTMAIICGCAMPMYGLCIALAADKTDLSLVEVTSGILLAHSLGSIIGPVVLSPPMTAAGPAAFFVFCSICLGAAAVWTFYRYFVAERAVGHEPHRRMLPRTTQAVAELLADEDRPDGPDSANAPGLTDSESPAAV